MKLKRYFVVALFGMLFVLGNGCTESKVVNNEEQKSEGIITRDDVVTSTLVGGVSLYVRSLEQSTKNILAAAKEVNIVEYKSSELTEKNKVKTLFLTIPNDKVMQAETILAKEATNKVVFGAKNLFGDFLPEERPKNGTTNFEISLIDVSILQ
jgi:signal-transduction protein with cAMP-binding, CBS, and nucleotidyltransferase domain